MSSRGGFGLPIPGPGRTMADVRRLVLASRSPRRQILLREAGFVVTTCPVSHDERRREGEAPVPFALRIAEEKLRLAQQTHNPPQTDIWWLAADTVVWFDDDPTPLGKPPDEAAARRVLTALTSGQPHRVTTAWSVARGRTGTPQVAHETTRVWMRSLTDEELGDYLATGQWRDKAGGYGIQAHAASWVTRIEGSYTSVIGLPVAQVIEHLRKAEFTEPGR